MPNWCANEIHLSLSDHNHGICVMEEILDFVRETIPNYDRRIRISERYEKIHHPDILPWQYEKIPRRAFSFESLIPYPDEYRQRDEDAALLTAEEFAEKYGPDAVTKNGTNIDAYNNGGYEWCIKNWGSKWTARDVVWVPEHKTFYFNTAWAPVFPIVSALHKQFPHVHIYFEYYERGTGVVGGCEYIAEEYAKFATEYIPMGKDHEIEMAMKKNGEAPDFPWEPGQAYNFWEADYQGYKGG